MAYLGHSLNTVTDLYTSHDVESYLRSDSELLRRFIAVEDHDPTHED